jgi:4-hydroxybenzoate polyprenyltransferase
MPWPFYLALAIGASQLAWQIRTVDITDPKNCLAKFKSSRNFGLIILAGIVAGQVMS